MPIDTHHPAYTVGGKIKEKASKVSKNTVEFLAEQWRVVRETPKKEAFKDLAKDAGGFIKNSFDATREHDWTNSKSQGLLVAGTLLANFLDNKLTPDGVDYFRHVATENTGGFPVAEASLGALVVLLTAKKAKHIRDQSQENIQTYEKYGVDDETKEYWSNVERGKHLVKQGVNALVGLVVGVLVIFPELGPELVTQISQVPGELRTAYNISAETGLVHHIGELWRDLNAIRLPDLGIGETITAAGDQIDVGWDNANAFAGEAARYAGQQIKTGVNEGLRPYKAGAEAYGDAVKFLARQPGVAFDEAVQGAAGAVEHTKHDPEHAAGSLFSSLAGVLLGVGSIYFGEKIQKTANASVETSRKALIGLRNLPITGVELLTRSDLSAAKFVYEPKSKGETTRKVGGLGEVTGIEMKNPFGSFIFTKDNQIVFYESPVKDARHAIDIINSNMSKWKDAKSFKVKVTLSNGSVVTGVPGIDDQGSFVVNENGHQIPYAYATKIEPLVPLQREKLKPGEKSVTYNGKEYVGMVKKNEFGSFILTPDKQAFFFKLSGWTRNDVKKMDFSHRTDFVSIKLPNGSYAEGYPGQDEKGRFIVHPGGWPIWDYPEPASAAAPVFKMRFTGQSEIPEDESRFYTVNTKHNGPQTGTLYENPIGSFVVTKEGQVYFYNLPGHTYDVSKIASTFDDRDTFKLRVDLEDGTILVGVPGENDTGRYIILSNGKEVFYDRFASEPSIKDEILRAQHSYARRRKP
jgi:hypothetical protein